VRCGQDADSQVFAMSRVSGLNMPFDIPGASMTKNELYSRLTFEGVARGYEVICEYAIQSEERKILLDLVWVRRRNTDGPFQNAPNPAFWRLIAAFEIE
jgi:hypothetical protein